MDLIHKQSANHRESILKSKQCGCFYCVKLFSPKIIDEWIDEDENDVGTTAMCPFCGIDSVLPDNIGPELNIELLRGMNQVYF